MSQLNQSDVLSVALIIQEYCASYSSCKKCGFDTRDDGCFFNNEPFLWELKKGDCASSEPKRKIGKWIVDRYCSECEWDKKDASDIIAGYPENYCPNCGARMVKTK